MNLNPMHQFEVYKIGPEINLNGINISFTNASLFMTISAILIMTLLLVKYSVSTHRNVSDSVGRKEGRNLFKKLHK